jgi:hypothetical protein
MGKHSSSIAQLLYMLTPSHQGEKRPLVADFTFLYKLIVSFFIDVRITSSAPSLKMNPYTLNTQAPDGLTANEHQLCARAPSTIVLQMTYICTS